MKSQQKQQLPSDNFKMNISYQSLHWINRAFLEFNAFCKSIIEGRAVRIQLGHPDEIVNK